ncbi:MAG TPA: helix-hairpin-helix domain-containing protein [Polyangiaceae bacterium]|nr:helix-hairpin-helix domain-containing protein [Polyangiaceae bacterium]
MRPAAPSAAPPSASVTSETRSPLTTPGGAPSAVLGPNSLAVATTEPAGGALAALSAPTAFDVAASSPGALDTSVTEIPPPSRATPTVPSPGADPMGEPSPTPPRTQSSAGLSSGGNGLPANSSLRPESSRIHGLLADLMSARKEVTERAAELRRVVTERNALRTRLLRAESKASELASAFRAEAQLRSDFVDAHATSSASLRARVAELEAELVGLPELELRIVDLEVQLSERDEQLRKLSAEATRVDSKPPSERVGLRRIRGIGPAYERALLALGITTVAQVAQFSAEEIARIAPLIKARADRILRDDWVGQARLLSDD